MKKHILNDKIRGFEVRLVGHTKYENDIIPTADALGLARDEGLDLVLINQKELPAICKIMDYTKFVYTQKKNNKKKMYKEKKNQKKIADKKENKAERIKEFRLAVKDLRELLKDGLITKKQFKKSFDKLNDNLEKGGVI